MFWMGRMQVPIETEEEGSRVETVFEMMTKTKRWSVWNDNRGHAVCRER